MLYSIIETAKANGLTPFDYIADCLEQLSSDHVDVETLLTWKVNTDNFNDLLHQYFILK